ncbi:TonB-dependent receptor [Rubrivirga sp. IMCC43871]|uniref:TonB-dependent receptor n=1 Tax=Rubrivirga sp. IMCC43871 TaxID=3391575 RepID=UPI00398FA7E8
MRRLLLAPLAILLTASAAAQPATLNGFVRDAASGETLIQATVTVEATGRGAATNVQGFYTLGNLPAGETTVTASYLGYQALRRTVTLAPGETRRLDLDLQPAGVTTGEVVVEAEEPIEEERAPGTANVSIDLVEALPTVFEADLFRSIQLLPGVKASSDFSSALYIRGGSPDQTLILLDGTTVYNPTHFFGFFSTFNTEAIKDVRLYKGAYPSTYGGRLGSVVDVYNRDGNRRSTAGSLSLGLLASRVGVEGPLPAGASGSYSFNARRSTLEPLLAVLREQLDEDGIPESFYFYDLNGKVSLDLTPNDRVSLATYAGRDKVVVPFGDDARFDLDYGNRTGSLAYNRVLSGTAFAQLRLTASRYFSYPVGSFAGTEFERPNTLTDYSARGDLEWLPNERFEARAGVWGGFLTLGLASSFNGNTQTDYENPSRYASGYVQGKARAGEWIATGGLRAEYFRSETKDLRPDAQAAVGSAYLRFSPQVQLERTMGEGMVVQLAAGRYHQFLSLISNEAFSGFDTWVTTGVGVPPQASEQVVLGVKTNLGEAYRLDVEVYGRTLRDLFDIDPNNQDVAGLDYQSLFRFGEGYAYGAEFLLERGLGRLTGLVGYTIGATRRRYPNQSEAFQSYFPPKYDRLHDLTAVAQYDLGRGWQATVAGAYATGQAYTTPAGFFEAGGLPFQDDTLPVLVSNGLNTARLTPYHRVDVGATKRGAWSFADYELQLQLVNVYNRRNLWFVTYDFDANPVEVGEVRQLPILPNVSLSLSFGGGR